MEIASIVNRKWTLILIFSFVPAFAFASLDLTRLNPGNTTFKSDVETITKAVTFSILQPESRTKIPGAWAPFLETGYHVNSVNDKRLYLYTDSGHSPSAFHSLFATLGLGLPFGLAVSMGITQVISEHALNGIYASLTAQVFDFSNIVYTDLVPTLTIDATVARTLSDPSCSIFTGQANVGAFQRVWGMQFAYIFQTTYSTLTAVDHSNSFLFIRHGAMTAVPLWGGVSLRTQVTLPDLSGTIGLGYEF
jgi:hypothetical protein